MAGYGADNHGMTSRTASPTPNAPDAEPLLIGDSPAMQQLREMVALLGPAPAPVLLSGPSGAGKDVTARALHAAGGASRPFVAVNCGAIPAELIESELFGHEKGAFTGAAERRIGRFEAANGGTLFLDEIGDMPLDAQVRLLRVLEGRSFERVGSTKPIAFTGRIVAATHRNLAAMVEAGTFREDLYFRLAVFPLQVPALDERREDVPALTRHLAKLAQPSPRFSEAALAALAQRAWSGNVRELRTLVERAALLVRGREVAAGDIALLAGFGQVRLPQDAQTVEAAAPATPRLHAVAEAPDPDLNGLLEGIERRQLQMALERARGVVADAARSVGLSRTTFIDRMRRHRLNRGDEAIAA